MQFFRYSAIFTQAATWAIVLFVSHSQVMDAILIWLSGASAAMLLWMELENRQSPLIKEVDPNADI